jgi:two-component system, cell cycle sensor histidine kinase and response regulator CckA
MEEHEKTTAEPSRDRTIPGHGVGQNGFDTMSRKPAQAGEQSSIAFLHKKQNIDNREAWLRAEELICDISARFIETGTRGIDEAMRNVLGAVGAFIGSDNVHLFIFGEDGNRSDRLFSWYGGTNDHPAVIFPLLPSDWLKQRLSCSGMCHIAYRSSLPEESAPVREAWESHGIRSLLAIPLVLNETLSGFVGLFSFHTDKAWTESDVITLRLAGEMLANVLNRRQTEENLQAYETRMSSLFDVVPGAIAWIGTDGKLREVRKPGGETLFGKLDVRAGMSIGDLDMPPDAALRLMSSVRKSVETGERQQFELLFPIHGEPRVFEVRIAKSGEEEAVSAIREAQSEIGKDGHEGILTIIALQSIVGAYLIQDGFFRYVNPHFAETLGYSPQEIVGKKGPADLAHSEDRGTVLENLEKRMSGEVETIHYEFRGIKKDGELTDLEVCGARTTYQGRPAIMGVMLNISDRKRLETQLIQSERMKAIGPLAGGIAHDFNNILMAIQGYTSLMLHLLDAGHAHYGKLKGIEDLVASGSELTKQLLSFASGGTYQVRPTDLNEIVRKTSNMFARTKKEVSIQSQYDQASPVVDVDSGQIEQVLLNLYVNAWQAMPGGGTLMLTTDTVAPGKQLVRAYSLKAGKHAMITVTDTGVGMDERTRERIFEPFFTTKERGRGTGLGLASAYNIIKGHGGAITVESEKGKGTTFHIYLPLSKKTVEKPEAVHQAVLKGKETILLVDDEDTVITVNRDMLEALGYSVLVARSGKEALEIYHKSAENIDLVILDAIMPDMGGEETFEHLQKINPSVGVVLSSGYSLEGPMRKIMDHGCKAFIQKPFTINTLSQKLREVLGTGK